MTSDSQSGQLPAVAAVASDEREQHRDFVLRHIDFVTELLTGEQFNRWWSDPCGCPHATPELMAHRRDSDGSSFECAYERIETLEDSNNGPCPCFDPLHGSDDPLDAVAAVILSERTGVTQRYFDHSERALVAQLRREAGTWSEIATLETSELQELCGELYSGRGIAACRVERLSEALEILSNHRWIDDPTLTGLPRVPYKSLHSLLAGLPGISDTDAWWLVLTALDKPVWPSGPEIDSLLAELGLLAPPNLDEVMARRPELEDSLTPRQILPFHRALAAHVRYCDPDHTETACEFRKFTLSHRWRQQTSSDGRPVAVDLFSGAGGLSYGLAREDFDIAMAIDNNEDAADTYRLNHPDIPHSRVCCEDISEIAEDSEILDEIASDVDVVVGGPPCQALSKAGFRARRADDDEYCVLDDPRADMYKHYVNILEQIEPAILVMENVKGILSEIGDTGRRVIEDVETALDEAGYESDYRTVDCSEYGIPQERERVLVVGVNRSEFNYPGTRVQGLFADLERQSDVSDRVSIQQALTNLPRIRRGEGADVTGGRAEGRPGEYVREHGLGSGTRLVFNHRARRHPMDKDQELFDEVLEPGDTGWDVKYQKGRADLIDYDVGTEDNPAFEDKYRMLHWDRPSPTIVAHLAKDANSFILPDYYQYVHENPEQSDNERNRGITPREAARLQSFPDSYIFLGSFTAQFRQIGNAVPPLLGQHIASVIDLHLRDAMVRTSSEMPSRTAVSTDD